MLKATRQPSNSLLEVTLDRLLSNPSIESTPSVVEQLRTAESTGACLTAIFGEQLVDVSPDAIRATVDGLIAELDRLLTEQVNAILHHPRFQQLESSWRGIEYLLQQIDEAHEWMEEDGEWSEVKLRVWNVSKSDLAEDFDASVEFDDSQAFRLIYENAFGIAGGHPFGMLVGDYQFTNHPSDIELLQNVSAVAAAAFAPFVSAAAPELFGFQNFSVLQHPIDVAGQFSGPDYIKWEELRRSPDSRFLGLVVPRIVMRHPYADDGSLHHGFRFREDVSRPDASDYLWGNAAYAFAGVAIRAFVTTGWFADIRGTERGMLGGGIVTGIGRHSFHTDKRGIVPKINTELALVESRERELASLGFIPLSPCKDTEFSAFYSNQSVHEPSTYSEQEATANSRISAMLQYILCASRFAHYLKIIGRESLGKITSARELKRELNQWLSEYKAGAEASPELRARHPLRAAEVLVKPVPGSGGAYQLDMRLQPHFQLDNLAAGLELMTRLAPMK